MNKVMEISEIVEKLNRKEKLDDVAVSLGISKDKLRRKLKDAGYVYNNSTKVYELNGELHEKNEIDEKKDSDLHNKKTENEFRNKSEYIRNEMKQDSEIYLNKDEIKFVKDLYKSRNNTDKKFEIVWEKLRLPSRKPEKKTPYIISQKTFDDFKKFADELENEYRITQNELIEIALRKLMEEWGVRKV